MDSIDITIARTGAATAVAARYLSRTDSKSATICGCGNQGRISLRALMRVRTLERVYDDEICIFDSTGTALQDVVAAVLVYERALKTGYGLRLDLAE